MGATPNQRANLPEFQGSPGHDNGRVEKYEFVPDQYTYTVGDATEAYSRKIDFFKREFVFLNNQHIITFDKVKSIDPSFKKVWTMHTIGTPV